MRWRRCGRGHTTELARPARRAHVRRVATGRDPERLPAEARRLFLRYAEEIVERFGLCPWAAAARTDGRVRIEIVRGEEPSVAEALACIDVVEHDAGTDVGILVFPELVLDRIPFQHFAAALRQADAERKSRGDTVLAMADFHPNAEPDLGSPDRLVAFVRRTPDPVIQLVRRSALAAVRLTEDTGTRFVEPGAFWSPGGAPLTSPPEPVSDRVARANLRTVERVGIEAVRAVLDDIARDRDRSYAALGLIAPAWRAGITRRLTT